MTSTFGGHGDAHAYGIRTRRRQHDKTTNTTSALRVADLPTSQVRPCHLPVVTNRTAAEDGDVESVTPVQITNFGRPSMANDERTNDDTER